MIITDGTNEITLRDPVATDLKKIDLNAISRYTRGGQLKQLSDWPVTTYYSYEFTLIKESVVNELKLFVLANLGKLVSFGDVVGYLNMDGIIITTQQDICSYSFTLNIFVSIETFDCYLLAEDSTVLQSEYGDDFVLEYCQSDPLTLLYSTIIRRGPIGLGFTGMHPYLGYWYNGGSRTPITGRDSVIYPSMPNCGYISLKARIVITPLGPMAVSNSIETIVTIRPAFADIAHVGFMYGNCLTPLGPKGVF